MSSVGITSWDLRLEIPFFWREFSPNNMKKLIFFLIALTTFFVLSAGVNTAEASVAEPSAQLKSNFVSDSYDHRVDKLKSFLERHNSPLSEYAETFIFYADLYQLDWRLVPAITGVESTFGKRIPFNSYNAYGWANGVYKFNSWEESIEIVSKTLREKYLDKGATNIYKIAKRYAPPSSTWANKVKYFMAKIDPFPVTFDFEG